MACADYGYYRDTYQGSLPEEDFTRLSRRASAYLNRVALGRITPEWAATEAVKDACCAVVEELVRQERGGEVVTANNDGYSETYAASGKSVERRLYEAAALHLGMTGLLYRGV